MFVDGFYYDEFTSLIRENKTFSFILNNYAMYYSAPVYVGINYEFVYAGNFDNINEYGHKVGMAVFFQHYFSDTLSIFGDFYAGQYLNLPSNSGYGYLSKDGYFEFEVGVQFKIF